jgi:tetratricopeptide (TPR) repeat protein
MATSGQTVDDPIAAGNESLARGEWADARAWFETALAAEESPQALEGLGWAGWWLADAELTLTARERAFRGYRAAGDPGSAARVAAWLASDYLEFRGEDAIGRGWLERARRLLDGLPESADHGWVAVNDAGFVGRADPDRVAQLAGFGARLGRELGVPDLEAVGLAQEGGALIAAGRVADGMRCLEEAAAVATGEAVQLPVSRGWALCCLISACEGVGDFPRAAQGCEALRGWTERWGSRHALGVCRMAHGRVLVTRGDWAEAEAELVKAVEDFELARPGIAADGLVRLAELRTRQGRVDEAAALYERAGAHPLALLGLGELGSMPEIPSRRATRPIASCDGCRSRACSAGCRRSSCRCVDVPRPATATPRPRPSRRSSGRRPSSPRRICSVVPTS